MSQVKISFFTKEEDLRIPEAPLYVPVSLKRYGLSDLVNQLLGDSNVPFDFLIDGVLLRTSVDEYLTKHGLSNEAHLRVEYTRAVLPPSFLASYNNDDWVSAVHTGNIAPSGQVAEHQILAGSYDGIVRAYNMAGEVAEQYVGHSAAVKAVSWIDRVSFVSAGNDRQVRLWREGATEAILEGHKAPVVDVAVSVGTSRVLSAGYDSVVGLWSTVADEMASVEPMVADANMVSTASKKRRKMALADEKSRRCSPLALLDGHAQPVEGVVFDQKDSSVAYSVSQDHTVKTWDLVTGRCVDTRSTGFSLLSVLQMPQKSLIVSGSSARHINLHDPRAGQTDTVGGKLVGHTNFVVDLAASPSNDNLFVSASHDGTVKVWDVRADKSLYTIERESKEKVFGVDWSEVGIVSGGSDKRVQVNKGIE